MAATSDEVKELRREASALKEVVTFLCESGDSFNRALAEAVAVVAWRRQDLELVVRTFASVDVQLVPFAQQIERDAEVSDGVVVIARDDPNVLRAARRVMRWGKPVVCLATDLPNACRCGFVGSDERSAGAAAAGLLGDLLGNEDSRVLFIDCGPYLAGKDREMGFRSILAERSPHLRIEHRVDVKNEPGIAYAVVKSHIVGNGRPDAIYSVAGGNSGVGRALVELGIEGKVIFIGHELNENSRALLRSGVMDYLIGRDQEQEVMLALDMLEAALEGRPHPDRVERQVRIISKHICN